MATQAPSTPDKKIPAKKVETPEATSPQPPEDTVWTRYSPHGEMQMSGAGSFALHALGIGLFLILGIFVYGKNKAKELPVEAVRLAKGGLGTGRGDGIGSGDDRESGSGEGDGSVVEGPAEEGRLSLNPEQMQNLPAALKEDPDAVRAIRKGHPNARMFSELNESARNKLRSGLNPGGNKGSGDSGGKSGGSAGAANDREKRMFRWRINFERGAPAGYLDQLGSMGAILGVPMDDDSKTYQTIRNLKARPAKVLKEDPMSLGMICWFNNDPVWAEVVMNELKVNMKPSHFVVFFPIELEEKFLEAETRYKGRKESQIAETWFRMRNNGKRWEPYVDSQTAK